MSRALHYIGRADHAPIDDARHFHVCATCGQPMRIIPSTRKGQYFLRCATCGITREAEAAPA